MSSTREGSNQTPSATDRLKSYINLEMLNNYANLEYLTINTPNPIKYHSTIDAAFYLYKSDSVSIETKVKAVYFICYVYSIIGLKLLTDNDNDAEGYSYLYSKYNINKMFLYNLIYMYNMNETNETNGINTLFNIDLQYKMFNELLLQYLDIIPTPNVIINTSYYDIIIDYILHKKNDVLLKLSPIVNYQSPSATSYGDPSLQTSNMLMQYYFYIYAYEICSVSRNGPYKLLLTLKVYVIWKLLNNKFNITSFETIFGVQDVNLNLNLGLDNITYLFDTILKTQYMTDAEEGSRIEISTLLYNNIINIFGINADADTNELKKQVGGIYTFFMNIVINVKKNCINNKSINNFFIQTIKSLCINSRDTTVFEYYQLDENEMDNRRSLDSQMSLKKLFDISMLSCFRIICLPDDKEFVNINTVFEDLIEGVNNIYIYEMLIDNLNEIKSNTENDANVFVLNKLPLYKKIFIINHNFDDKLGNDSCDNCDDICYDNLHLPNICKKGINIYDPYTIENNLQIGFNTLGKLCSPSIKLQNTMFFDNNNCNALNIDNKIAEMIESLITTDEVI